MADLTPARSVLVGRSPRAQVRAVEVRLDGQARASFTLESDLDGPTERAEVRLGLHGEHHVANALSVAAVALTLGLTLPEVAGALSSASPASRWRMEVHDRPDGIRVVNDAYHANPDSMRAALQAVVAMSAGRRTWAVLGAMLELGADSDEEHAEIGRLAGELGIDRLLVVGDGARAMYDAARAAPTWAEPPAYAADAQSAYEVLVQQLAPGDIVLLKSSRDAGLRLLGDRLTGAGGEGA
jgi:UDP-N-acetylmuramoyl-tripeptide--D-alanyl-D-alanine ligase